MRSDAIGLFWQDLPRSRKDRVARVMPPIPDTGWTTPTEFPNLAAARALTIDVETYDPELLIHGPGWARGVGHLVGIAVGTDDGRRWYMPMRHEVERDYNLDPEHVLAWARDNLTNPAQPKLGANITYDVGWLRQEGVHVAGPLFDVQFAEALLMESATVALDDLGERYLGIGKQSSVLYQWCADYYGGAPTDIQRRNIHRAPPRLVGPYAEGDVYLPYHVLNKQWPLLIQQGLTDVFALENRLIYLMVEMRFAGVAVNTTYAESLQDIIQQELDEIDAAIYSLLGFSVNTNAAASIAEAFDILGLAYGRTKKGSPSFTKEFLESVDHPFVELVLKKRAREKLLGTFIQGYILNSQVGGKVYGSFHQLRSDEGGARSGRFSSSDPNLQNIPVRSKLGNAIRKAFVPDPGHVRWRKYDYCVAPDTRILTTDFCWVPAHAITNGDSIIAFDEESNNRRYLHRSTVLKTSRLQQPCYRIKTTKTEIVCSAQHRWLAQTSPQKYAARSRWVTTKDLRVGHRIVRAVDTWTKPKETYDLGWLAGIFDGEGWLTNQLIGMGQKEGTVYSRTKELLAHFGFAYKEYLNAKSNVQLLRLTGGRSETWRFLGSVRPRRLLSKAIESVVENRTVTCWIPADDILGIEYIGNQDVIGLQTEHGTFLAEGLCSHNSQIEYRGLAHYAVGPGSDDIRYRYQQDPNTDFHAMVQGIIKDVVGLSLERPLVKNINFGTVYGMGPRRLALYLGLTRSEADHLFDSMHKAAPFLRATMDATMNEANELGYITTILGRRSRFDLWVPAAYDEGAKPLPFDKAVLTYVNLTRAYIHKALNRRLQGSAADLLKMAMVQCWEDGIFAETGVPRLTVHDELDFSDPGGKDEAFAAMEHVMETAIPFSVPIRVECAIGPSWGEVAKPPKE